MTIDRPRFAEECVRQGSIFRIEPHYMLAVAQLRSGIADDNDGDRIGPFRLSQAEWDANRENEEFGIHFIPAQITGWRAQCAVFGLMTHRAFNAFMSAHARDPSTKELYLQQWPDAASATLETNLQKALEDTAMLVDPAADAVLDTLNGPPR